MPFNQHDLRRWGYGLDFAYDRGDFVLYFGHVYVHHLVQNLQGALLPTAWILLEMELLYQKVHQLGCGLFLGSHFYGWLEIDWYRQFCRVGSHFLPYRIFRKSLWRLQGHGCHVIKKESQSVMENSKQLTSYHKIFDVYDILFFYKTYFLIFADY